MKKLFVLLVTSIMCMTNAHAQQTKEEVQQRQQELQKEIAALNASYDQIKKNKKQSLAQLAIVQKKVRAREALVNNLNKELDYIDNTSYSIQREINRMKLEFDTLKINYAHNLAFAYKNRSNYDYLSFIFSSTNFNDAIKRITYLKSYREYRETQAGNIIKTKEVLQQKREALLKNKGEKQVRLVEQGKQLKVLEEDKKEQNRVMKDLKGREKEVAKEIAGKEKMRKRLTTSLQAIIRKELKDAENKEKKRLTDLAAAKKAAAEEAKRAKQSVNIEKPKPGTSVPVTKPTSTGTISIKSTGKPRQESYLETTPEGLTLSLNFESNRGRLPWPASGSVMTSFGDYEIPNTKLIGHNNGVELSVEQGATVKSVADGEVNFVIHEQSGDVVVIKHGKYFTSYAYLSNVSVSKGKVVKAGTVLGQIAPGDAGGCLLTFMVSNEKGFLNPETWLRRK